MCCRASAVVLVALVACGRATPTSAVSKQLLRYKKKLLERWESLPPVFVTSATSKSGKEELLSYIEHLNKTIDATTF